MRAGSLLLAALCAAFLAAPARAQTGPVIAIPGKPGVPVIINGVVARLAGPIDVHESHARLD